jgi:hypothetical protein
MEVVAGFALPRTRTAATDAAARVREIPDIPDMKGAVLGSHHGDGEFALRTIAGFHDLANSQPTVLRGDVWLMPVG